MKKILLISLAALFLVGSLQVAALGGARFERTARLSRDHPAATSPDNDGSARVALAFDGAANEVCYRIRFEKITVRGVYVYRNNVANDGRFATVKLYDEAPTDESPLVGCVQEVSAAAIRKMKSEPKLFYIEAFEYDGNNIAGTLKRP